MPSCQSCDVLQTHVRTILAKSLEFVNLWLKITDFCFKEKNPALNGRAIWNEPPPGLPCSLLGLFPVRNPPQKMPFQANKQRVAWDSGKPYRESYRKTHTGGRWNPLPFHRPSATISPWFSYHFTVLFATTSPYPRMYGFPAVSPWFCCRFTFAYSWVSTHFKQKLRNRASMSLTSISRWAIQALKSLTAARGLCLG